MAEASIPRLTVAKRNYNSQVIEHLQELLEQAKAGQIMEIMTVSKLPGGEYQNTWTGAENLIEVVGYLERMKLLTLRRMDT